ncbi:hypothetical protein BJ875DRAFT_440176, partial [Amylocarpus encephaloides]
GVAESHLEPPSVLRTVRRYGAGDLGRRTGNLVDKARRGYHVHPQHRTSPTRLQPQHPPLSTRLQRPTQPHRKEQNVRRPSAEYNTSSDVVQIPYCTAPSSVCDQESTLVPVCGQPRGFKTGLEQDGPNLIFGMAACLVKPAWRPTFAQGVLQIAAKQMISFRANDGLEAGWSSKSSVASFKPQQTTPVNVKPSRIDLRRQVARPPSRASSTESTPLAPPLLSSALPALLSVRVPEEGILNHFGIEVLEITNTLRESMINDDHHWPIVARVPPSGLLGLPCERGYCMYWDGWEAGRPG